MVSKFKDLYILLLHYTYTSVGSVNLDPLMSRMSRLICPFRLQVKLFIKIKSTQELPLDRVNLHVPALVPVYGLLHILQRLCHLLKLHRFPLPPVVGRGLAVALVEENLAWSVLNK